MLNYEWPHLIDAFNLCVCDINNGPIDHIGHSTKNNFELIFLKHISIFFVCTACSFFIFVFGKIFFITSFKISTLKFDFTFKPHPFLKKKFRYLAMPQDIFFNEMVLRRTIIKKRCLFLLSFVRKNITPIMWPYSFFGDNSLNKLEYTTLDDISTNVSA